MWSNQRPPAPEPPAPPKPEHQMIRTIYGQRINGKCCGPYHEVISVNGRDVYSGPTCESWREAQQRGDGWIASAIERPSPFATDGGMTAKDVRVTVWCNDCPTLYIGKEGHSIFMPLSSAFCEEPDCDRCKVNIEAWAKENGIRVERLDKNSDNDTETEGEKGAK